MHLGDDGGGAAKQYGKVISELYSAALSLDAPSLKDVLIKRSKTYLAIGLCQQALDDANQAIALDPSSPFGYELKYAVLRMTGDHGNAGVVFKEMLSRIEQSPDPKVQRLGKIGACILKGVDGVYYDALDGNVPGAENMLMWQCIAHIHEVIVTCWNFKDNSKILGGTEFKQLMLYLVEDVRTQPFVTLSRSLDKFGDFVNLITATTINPVAPPVAMLGLSSSFVKWVSSAVVRQTPEVERFLMAYIIDLISVLKSLFDLAPMASETDWKVLKKVFEDYERSNRRKKIHESCRAVYGSGNQILSREIFTRTIKKLLDESLEPWILR